MSSENVDCLVGSNENNPSSSSNHIQQQQQLLDEDDDDDGEVIANPRLLATGVSWHVPPEGSTIDRAILEAKGAVGELCEQHDISCKLRRVRDDRELVRRLNYRLLHLMEETFISNDDDENSTTNQVVMTTTSSIPPQHLHVTRDCRQDLFDIQEPSDSDYDFSDDADEEVVVQSASTTRTLLISGHRNHTANNNDAARFEPTKPSIFQVPEHDEAVPKKEDGETRSNSSKQIAL